jgi:hypothetical protein
MSADWYKKQPKNRNFLSPVGFKLRLEKFEGTDFFCQSANLPDISVTYTEVPTRFRSFPILGGGGVAYGDLNVTFIIDEDLENYSSIWKWIRVNGVSEEHMPNPEPEYSGGQLYITTSNYNNNFVIDFQKLFPVSLTEVRFDATANDIEYFTAQVVFKYTGYTIKDKNFIDL